MGKKSEKKHQARHPKPFPNDPGWYLTSRCASEPKHHFRRTAKWKRPFSSAIMTPSSCHGMARPDCLVSPAVFILHGPQPRKETHAAQPHWLKRACRQWCRNRSLSDGHEAESAPTLLIFVTSSHASLEHAGAKKLKVAGAELFLAVQVYNLKITSQRTLPARSAARCANKPGCSLAAVKSRRQRLWQLQSQRGQLIEPWH